MYLLAHKAQKICKSGSLEKSMKSFKIIISLDEIKVIKTKIPPYVLHLHYSAWMG